MTSKPVQYAEIVVDIPLNKKFHYGIPEELGNRLEAGHLVRVPFGTRTITGYCVGFTDTPDVKKIKNIKQIIEGVPRVDEGILKLTKWMASYYRCGWGEALSAAMPGGIKKGAKERRVKSARLAKSVDEIKNEIGLISKRTPAQAKLLSVMLEDNADMTAKELLTRAGSTAPALAKLAERGLVELFETAPLCDDVLLQPSQHTKAVVSDDILSDEQKDAIGKINDFLSNGKFGVILLQGVTGSGKTEVYLRAIAIAASLGMCSIVLLPEIALTPQTIRYFQTRFAKIAVLHSYLTDANRRKQWKRIKDGDVDLVIGTRSAVFAPVKKLGLIIVDEEHENTFKQDTVPRYHARDVGVMRAMFSSATAILGTATPSLESYYNAMTGKYSHVVMSRKIGKMAPTLIETVNMEVEFKETMGFRYLSRRLEDNMTKALERDEQIILFLNRRGFAPFINCRKCGFILKCKSCDITLTYHKKTEKMVCHYCRAEQLPPKNCPECSMANIKYQGFGTERIEEAISRRFPEQTILRMDSDTIKEKDAYQRMFSAFHNREANILLGTQMIAKGLDFENVTLVGVLSADASLNIPDFRSSERTFQLLAQVSGRTGRGEKGGLVIIQAFDTEHYSITRAVKSDYDGFAKEELEFRKQLNYPPFGRIVRAVFLGKDEKRVIEKAHLLTSKLKYCAEMRSRQISVLGPAPASISKIKDKFRWHTILKAPKITLLHDIINDSNLDREPVAGAQIYIDVDPANML